jgi:hypothetical protein
VPTVYNRAIGTPSRVASRRALAFAGSLLFLYDLAHCIYNSDTATDMALLFSAFTWFQVTIACHLAGFLFALTGSFLQEAAFDPWMISRPDRNSARQRLRPRFSADLYPLRARRYAWPIATRQKKTQSASRVAGRER